MKYEPWEARVDAYVASGSVGAAVKILKDYSEDPRATPHERVAALSRLVLLLIQQSRYGEAHAISQSMIRDVGSRRLPKLFILSIAYLICLLSERRMDFLESFVRSILHRFFRNILKPHVSWNELHAILWGVYWQDINLALQYNVLAYAFAKTPDQRARSSGFLAYTLAIKGHPTIGIPAMKRAIEFARREDIVSVLKDMYVFLSVALQMSSRVRECFQVYETFEREFPNASSFSKIICAASRLNVSFSELGPVEASLEVDRCFAVSFALKENRNHIQIYGVKAALLALEGRSTEALIYLEKSRVVAERNSNTLDWLIHYRLASAVHLNNGVDRFLVEDAIREAKKYLNMYGRPSWYGQEIARIEMLSRIRSPIGALSKGLRIFRFLAHSIGYCNGDRLRKASKILRFAISEERADYWSSHQSRDYLRQRLIFEQKEGGSRALLEKQTLNISTAFESAQAQFADSMPTFEGLLAQIERAFPDGKVVHGVTLTDCLEELRRRKVTTKFSVFDDKDMSLRIPCEEGRYFIAVQTNHTDELNRQLSVGVLVPHIDVNSLGIVEAGLKLLLNNYVTLTSIWLSRIEHTKNREKLAVANMANQVAHDIRSPISLLLVITDESRGLPEGTRTLLRTAVNRIRDIANNLTSNLQRPLIVNATSKKEIKESAISEVSLMPSLIESILSEKRMEYRDNVLAEIYGSLDSSCYGAFAKIELSDFRRLMSNLINNGVEALEGNRGFIRVVLESNEQNVFVTVEDSGKGIPPEVLDSVGRRGFTHGKTNGSGLGLHHAMTSLKRWGGSLAIDSTPGRGTKIKLTFVRACIPSWFLSKLNVYDKDHLVILDDDDSVHSVWNERFRSRPGSSPELVHFRKISEVEDWMARYSRASTQFIFDYELVGSTESGIDLIERLEIQSRAVLVTSHFENEVVLRHCNRLGVSIAPKALAGWIPLQ